MNILEEGGTEEKPKPICNQLNNSSAFIVPRRQSGLCPDTITNRGVQDSHSLLALRRPNLAFSVGKPGQRLHGFPPNWYRNSNAFSCLYIKAFQIYAFPSYILNEETMSFKAPRLWQGQGQGKRPGIKLAFYSGF